MCDDDIKKRSGCAIPLIEKKVTVIFKAENEIPPRCADVAYLLKNYKEILETVQSSEVMNRQWQNYRKDFEYASGIEFSATCAAVVQLMDRIFVD